MSSQLDAVMHFVDKWFEDNDPRLQNDPANRANCAREIALKAIEKAEKERDEWKTCAFQWADVSRLSSEIDALDSTTSYMATYLGKIKKTLEAIKIAKEAQRKLLK